LSNEKGVRNLGRLSAKRTSEALPLFTDPGASSARLASSSPQAFPDVAAAAPGALAPGEEYAAAGVRSGEESKDAQQVRCVVAALPDDSVPHDCSVEPQADDHSVPVVLPDDYSAPVDSAAHDSVPDDCSVASQADDRSVPAALPDDYSAPADSAAHDSVPDDCSVASQADDHSAQAALPDDYLAPADSAAHDSAPAGCSAEADSVRADCSAALQADDCSAPAD
jgi:hypothetical protein